MNIINKLESIKNHDLTALENINNFIKIIDKNNIKINAFLDINDEEAIKIAENIDHKIKNGEKTGKLAGLVIAIKSNINVEDFKISAASRTLETYY